MCPSKLDLLSRISENSRKMADGRLLFQALHTCTLILCTRTHTLILQYTDKVYAIFSCSSALVSKETGHQLHTPQENAFGDTENN